MGLSYRNRGSWFVLLVLVLGLVLRPGWVSADDVLSISPGSANVYPKGSQAFTPSGGSGSGYQFLLTQNASNGSIDPATGAYTAGPNGPAVDVITLTDDGGNTATANVNVSAKITITPASPKAAPNETVLFAATGGSNSGFAWSFADNRSNGTIDGATGEYHAGATPGVSDKIHVTDSLGNAADVSVSVGDGITINPASPTPAPLGTVGFSAKGGSGLGYQWTMVDAPSGGSIVKGTGAYKAGANGNTKDVVKVTDSLGNMQTVDVNVGPQVSMSPLGPSIVPKGSISFGAAGGSGGYLWSVSTNKSGGSIDPASGSYVAGTTGSVTDTVKVVDSNGNTVSTNVTVGAGVSIVPAAPSIAPKGSRAFTASGGSGGGYTYSFVQNASNGTLDAGGSYVAGATGGVTDKVQVKDSLGNVAVATITVTAGISFTPANPSTPPNGPITFVVSGGAGAPYTFEIPTNNSGASFAANIYTAGATGNVADTVKISDALGNFATASVSVGGGLSINPAAPSVSPKQAVTFAGTGGSGMGYTWSIPMKPSGGTVNATTGKYTAGAVGSVTDRVRLVDSLGNARTVDIEVGPAVSIAPASNSVAPLGAITFSATGGSGKNYTWAMVTAASGGTISATGAYKAGPTGSVTDVVKVTDSLANTKQVSITVTAALAVTPVSNTVAPRGSKKYTATGGSGGYSFTLQTNASGGNVAQTSGAYTAGGLPGVTDVIKVTDSNGASVTATSTTGPGITITPKAPSATPLGTVQFAATGGSGTGYKWVISVNPSGGAMNADSALYRAGATTSVIDTVQVTDSLGNTSTTTVNVGGALVVVPSDVTTTPHGAIAFAAQGGSGTGYAWSFDQSFSGGTLDPKTGAYVAGSTGNVQDVIRVTDSLGRFAQATVTLTAGLTITPDTAKIDPRAKLSFVAAGGSGAGYVYTVTQNQSGATIDPGGNYAAGPIAGNDIVELSDSLGNKVTAAIQVGEPIVAPPPPLPPPSVIDEVPVRDDQVAGCNYSARRLPQSSWGLFMGVVIGLVAFVLRRRRPGS